MRNKKKILCLIFAVPLLVICIVVFLNLYKKNSRLTFIKSRDYTIDVDYLDNGNADTVSNECTDSYGNKYVTNGLEITIYDSSDNQIAVYGSETDYITSIAADSQGNVLFTHIEYTGDGKAQISSITSEAEVIPLTVCDSVKDNTHFILLGENAGFDGFRLFSDNVLYTYSIDSNECDECINFDETGFADVNPSSLRTRDDRLFLEGKRGRTLVNSRVEIGTFCVRINYLEEFRTPINLKAYDADTWLQDVICIFNSTNPKYAINLILPSDEIDINEDIDIIYGGMGDICQYDITSTFCDLDELCCFDEDCFIQNIWNSQKDVFGKRYWIAPFVEIQALYSDSDNVYDSYSHLVRSDTFETLFNTFLPYYLSESFSEGTLDEETYSSFISYLNDNSKPEYQEDYPVASALRSGELHYLSTDIGSFLQYVLLQEYFDNSPLVTAYPPFLSPVFSSAFYFSVFDSSRCKDGASEFINFICSDDILTMDLTNNFFEIPITETALETNIDWILELYSNDQIEDSEIIFTYKDGTEGGYGLPLAFYSAGDSEPSAIPVGNTTYRSNPPSGRRRIDNPNSYIEAYRSLLNSAHGFVFYDSYLMTIAEEEIQSYLAGDKDISTVSNITVNRIQTYLSENYE